MEENKKKISVRDMVEIAMFTAVVAVLSQISVPMPSGVPVTLQTLAVALCGYVLGSKRGAVSLIVYALLGMVGAPVFAGLKGGLGVITGPTGGFIWGFIFMAFLCGLGMELKHKWIAIVLGIAGVLVCHVCGTVQFALIKGNGFLSSALAVSVPYLIKDFASVVIAFGAAAIIRSRVKAAAHG